MQPTFVVSVLTAYRLLQKVVVDGEEYRAITYFGISNDGQPEAELDELCELWRSGQQDPRINEDLPPNSVYERHPTITTTAFYCPNGHNVLDDYREALGLA